MPKTNRSQHCKIFYRPIEAAIRWSGLIRFETHILDAVDGKGFPDPGAFPRWPMLHLNTERIFDGLRNGELPYGKSGITCDDPSLLDDPGVTVRHVNLKAWMARFYPDQKPAFLFDNVERQLHSAISVETVQTLLAEREALKARFAERERSFAILHEQHRSLCEQVEGRNMMDSKVSPRGEGTYLNIIGGLLTLLLGNSPSGKPYSSFKTVESIISALLAHHEGRPGISERTLWAKFTEAKRHLNANAR